MADRPDFRRFRELPYYSFTDFDSVGLVKAALRDLELGQFIAAAQLCDAMTRDDRISGVLQTRTEALPSLPLKMKEGEGSKANEIAGEAQKRWNEFWSPAAHAELLHWAFFLGVGIGENVWQLTDKGRLEPRLKVWHPRWAYWRWDTRSIWLSTMDGPVEVIPGNGQWVLLTPWGLERCWMKGGVRSLFVPWLLRQWAQRDSGRYSEAYGMPFKKGHVPPGAQQDEKDRFVRELATIASETTVLLPTAADGQKFDVEFVELMGTGSEVFEKQIELAGTNIAIRILGQNLTTEVKGGSYAAAGIHANIRNDILRSDAHHAADCAYKQTLRHWAAFNFGDPELAPIPEWNCDPPEDKKASADALTSAGAAAKELITSGIPIDGVKFAERFGIPVRDDVAEDQRRVLIPVTADLINTGTVTRNEAREAMELTPVEGGDEPGAVQAAAPEPEGDEGQEPKPGEKGKPKPKVKAASARQERAALEHQLKLDQKVRQVKHDVGGRLAVDLVPLFKAIDEARDFDELREKILSAYPHVDQKHLADLMEQALRVAELTGRDAVTAEAE